MASAKSQRVQTQATRINNTNNNSSIVGDLNTNQSKPMCPAQLRSSVRMGDDRVYGILADDILSDSPGDSSAVETSFICAAREGNLAKLENLVKHRNQSLINIDARDPTTGNTAIIWAVKRGYVQIVQLLLHHGADVTLKNFEGQTAVELAASSISRELLESVDKAGAHRTLLQAAWQGNGQLVRKILLDSRQVDINCCNVDGLTPLLLATRDIQLFEKLTPRLLRTYDPVSAIQQLLLSRADLHTCDEEGRTPLHLAASSKAKLAVPIVTKLIGEGADIDCCDRRLSSSIHCAALSGNSKVLKVLLSHGGDANAKAYAGATPLHISAIHGNDSVCSLLLEHGADVTAVDDGGFTPVDVAKTKKVRGILRAAWTELIERNKDSEMNLRPIKTSQSQRNSSLRQSWDFSPDHSPTKKHAPVNIEITSPRSASSYDEACYTANIIVGLSSVSLNLPNMSQEGALPTRVNVGTTLNDRHRLDEQNKCSPVMGSSSRGSPLMKRLQPLKGGKREIKFGPGTKLHDGSPTAGRKNIGDLRVQGNREWPISVTVLGQELDDTFDSNGRISRLKATTPRRGHFRNLSDTSADGCQSPALYDSPDEQSIYMRPNGRCSSKASIVTIGDEWDADALSTSPPRLTPLRPPSGNSLKSTYAASTRLHYGAKSPAARKPLKSFSSALHTLSATMPGRCESDMRVTDLSHDYSVYSSQENSPRSEDGSSSDLSDSDSCTSSDISETDVMLTAQTTIQRLRSASILGDRQFNIEDTRVKNIKSNDSGLGKSASSSTNSVSLQNVKNSGSKNVPQSGDDKKNTHKPLSKQGSIERVTQDSNTSVASQSSKVKKQGLNNVIQSTSSQLGSKTLSKTETKIVSNNLIQSAKPVQCLQKNPPKVSPKPTVKPNKSSSIDKPNVSSTTTDSSKGLSMATTAVVDVSGKVTKPKPTSKPGTITVKPAENSDCDKEKKEHGHLKVYPLPQTCTTSAPSTKPTTTNTFTTSANSSHKSITNNSSTPGANVKPSVKPNTSASAKPVTARPTQPPPKPPTTSTTNKVDSGKSSKSVVSSGNTSSKKTTTSASGLKPTSSPVASKRPVSVTKSQPSTSGGGCSDAKGVAATKSIAGVKSTSSTDLVNKKTGNSSVFKPAAIMKGQPSSNKTSESCVKTVLSKPSTNTVSQPSKCNSGNAAQDEKEHSGPVIFDPFDTIKREKAKNLATEVDINRVLPLKGSCRNPKPQTCKKPSEKSKSRQGSAVKKTTKVMKITNERLASEGKVGRPKSSKKGKGKKKKAKDTSDNDEDRITIIRNKDHPSDFEFIGGRGWHIATECNENNGKVVKLVRCSTEDVEDAEIGAEELPNYIHYIDEVTPTNKSLSKTLPTHTSLDSDNENGFDYSSYGMDNLSFDDLTESDSDSISSDDTTTDIVFPIEKGELDQDPVQSDKRPGLNTIISSVVIKDSDEAHSVNSNKKEPTKSRAPPPIPPRPSQTSPSTSTSVDTTRKLQNNGSEQGKPNSRKNSQERPSDGKTKSAINNPGDSTPVAPPRRRSRKSVSGTPPGALSSEKDLQDAIEDLMKTTPHPSLTLSLKSHEAPHRDTGNLRKSIDSVQKSMEARGRFERELLNSQDGKSFKRINSYNKKKTYEPVLLPPAGFTDDDDGDALEFAALHQDINIDDEEIEQLEKLMNSLRGTELQIDTVDPKTGSPKKVSAKPPVPPKTSAISPKIKSDSEDEFFAPNAISPRFVRRRDSWRNDLPTDDKFDAMNATSSTLTDSLQFNSKIAVEESSSGTNSDTLNRMQTSRLGRRSSSYGGRVDSAASNSSSTYDGMDVIKWTQGNQLGKGAYGTVWCGLTNAAEFIAVKQIEINLIDMERAEEEYQKVQEEVNLLKTLKHRNIVGYLGTSLEDNIVRIFMEYVPGGSVANIIERFGGLDEAVFSLYTKQILEGVSYLHKNNVIHRDIKGGNVMVTPEGVIKLIDFGCAKRMCLNMSIALDSSNNNRILKSMRGTPYWMAPEVVKEIGYGTKSDIWSIGCTVYEMATRKPPWAEMVPMAAIYAIFSDKPVPQLPEKFSTEARTFVEMCLIRDQNRRPSASDLLKHAFITKRRKKMSLS